MIQVVKIGGNIIDDNASLKAFLTEFAAITGPKILVHGGGKEATRLSAALGIETRMVEGRRVTDAATLEVVTMVYAGLINKRIVAMLRGLGIKAVGLSGADGGVITSHKRLSGQIDYGFVGDIDAVDSAFIKSLLNAGTVPVICAITCSNEGQLLNSNADSVANAVAVAAAGIDRTELTYCFEKPGVLADVDNPESLIAEITPANVDELKSRGIISGGMIPKIDNALKACGGGVAVVNIGKTSVRL